MKKITVKIKDLFNGIEKAENAELEYNVGYYQNENITIEGIHSDTYVSINALIKKRANIYKITFTDDVISCADNHLFVNDEWETKKASELIIGDRVRKINNNVTIVYEIERLSCDDVYDVSVDNTEHIYATTNGVLHHNTSMCAALALSYERGAGYRSIIVVPDTTLTDQTKEEYEMFGLDVGDYCGTSKDLKHQHIVATWQTLQNNKNVISEFDMIIVDECQGLRGAVLSELLLEYGKNIPYRFGCTGTLPEEEADAMSVRVAVGEVQYEIPAHELIEKGHLAELKIDILQLEVDFKDKYEQFLEDTKDEPDIPHMTYIQFKDAYFPDFTSEKSFLHTQKSRLKYIANYLQQRVLVEGNVLCLVNGIPFGKKLAKLIPGSVFLHGADGTKVRKEIYNSFKDNNDLIVIATVNIAGTGLNIKRIFNLVLVDMGKSFIRVIQAIGRGLRTAHDKKFVYVTDICSDLKYSKRHLAKRIKYYKTAKYPHEKRKVDY